MAKINFAPARHQRRKKVLKMAKGYFGSKSTLYKTAHEQVMRSLQYAYRDRKQRKRDFRKLWIARINAGCASLGMQYSRFIHGLVLAKVDVNRKVLADLAYQQPEVFDEYLQLAKSSLEKFHKELQQKETEVKKQETLTQQKEQRQIANKKQLELAKQKEQQEHIEKEKQLELAKQQEQQENIEKEKQLELAKQQEQQENIEKEKQFELAKQKEQQENIEKEKQFELAKQQEQVEKETQEKSSKVNSKNVVAKLSQMLLPELKKLAKDYQIVGIYKLKKNEIIALLKEILME